MLKLIYNLSKKVRVGKRIVATKNKVDLLVTTSHIVITLAFSLTQMISIFYNWKNYAKSYRMSSAYIFFGGLTDMFLSVMLWFILDTEKAGTIFIDGERTYAVRDIIKDSASSLNENCDDEDEHQDETAGH